MASSVIHLCVANEVNKRLKRDNRSILIGSIAPDISKQIGETKTNSHFLTDNTDIYSFLHILSYIKHINAYKDITSDKYIYLLSIKLKYSKIIITINTNSSIIFFIIDTSFLRKYIDTLNDCNKVIIIVIISSIFILISPHL